MPVCRIKRRDIEAGRIVERTSMIADRDHLETELMQFERGIGAHIAKP